VKGNILIYTEKLKNQSSVFEKHRWEKKHDHDDYDHHKRYPEAPDFDKTVRELFPILLG
jgi:hypothetical protein